MVRHLKVFIMSVNSTRQHTWAMGGRGLIPPRRRSELCSVCVLSCVLSLVCSLWRMCVTVVRDPSVCLLYVHVPNSASFMIALVYCQTVQVL